MHRPLRLTWPLLAVLLAVLCTAGPAAADYRDVLGECENGVLSKQYSAKDLKLASQKMSAYQRDYTNCSDAIVAGQSGSGTRPGSGSKSGSKSGSSNGGSGTSPGSNGSGGNGTSSGSGTSGGSGADGSTPGSVSALTPDEKYIASQAAVQQADAAGSPKQLLAAAKVPESALAYSSAGASLPLSLVIALVASAVLALLAVTMSLLARWRRTRVD